MLLCIIKAILAGISISIGSSIFIVSKWIFNTYTTYDALGTILGSFLFSIGLLLVCKFKLMLYTGKIGLAFEIKQNTKYWIEIITMLLFNITSSWCFGRLLRFIIDKTKFNSILNTINIVANSKIISPNVNSYLNSIIQSIFCGSCVHIAVKCFNYLQSVSGLVLLVWFVGMFVFSSFQHCIANCAYFGLNNIYSVKAITNICICVVGNMIGTIPISFITKTFISHISSSSSLSTDNESSSVIDFNKRKASV